MQHPFPQGGIYMATDQSVSTQPVPSQFLFDTTAAHQLEGTELPNGWKIIRKTRTGQQDPDGTGGHFSVGYEAERAGKKGFVKVFDLGGALRHHANNVMNALASMSINHQYETSLLKVCEQASLDRVVKVLAQDQVMIPAASGMTIPLPYIIFEMADGGDLRKAVARTNAIDDAWRLRTLHQVAVGLQQLHGVSIAHQDVKPSNVLMFDNEGVGAKLGDLGRASIKGGNASHDGGAIAGAIQYAPPEQAYGVRAAEEWRDRRESCDLYHLGCLISFAFTGGTPNEAYASLPATILPPIWGGSWTGTYDMVYPHISGVFAAYLNRIGQDFPAWGADDLVSLVAQLCNPDYRTRGAPEARVTAGSPLGLNRFITRLDVLANKATIKAKSA